MATRAVQGTILKPDNTPATGQVAFQLTAGFTDGGTYVALKQICKTPLDSGGFFSIELHSGTNVTYLCTLPSLEQFTFALPDGATPLDIVDVR